MIQLGVSMTVWDPDQISLLSDAAGQLGQKARIHLKVDTGMSRIGVQPEKALDLAHLAVDTPGIEYEGLYSHFARADEKDPTSADLQCTRFEEVVESLDKKGLLPPLVHIANSAASITRGETGLSFVRLGIAMYGLPPSAECPLPDGIRPALSWKSALSQVKTLPPGRGVSYGHKYVTKAHERIGTVQVGYADGYRRTAGNVVLVGGRRVPVVGRVTMDQILVQLDEVPGTKAGDEVVLIGKQGDELITAEDVAKTWGTVNYEVICAIGARVPRLYP
jgi:alanine racemase